MKNSVVLLITLFFITAISVLVLKNLDDSDKLLREHNYKLHNTQVLLAVKNIQKEVGKLILQNQENINAILSNDIFQASIPLEIEDLKLEFQISKYSKVDINKIKDSASKEVQELFLSNNLFDYERFKEIYNEKLFSANEKIQSNKQLDDIIDSFIKEVDNRDIEKIKQNMGFISGEDLYELNIAADYISSSVNAYYLLKNDGKVQYFEINFN